MAMEWESTTKSVSMRSLAEQGSVGGLLIRLMMVLQDYTFANRAMTAIGRPSKKKKQGDVKSASGQYYRRQAEGPLGSVGPGAMTPQSLP